ncbi:MAG: sigma-70 family RNA polymerase sigma factor [Armatimonadota bacterium]
MRPRLTRMAIHYARCCREDADDLLQEAWAGLLEALPAVDPHIGDPEQYLIHYARWRLLDAIKRAQVRRCDLLDDLLVGELVMPESETPLETLNLSGFLQQLTCIQQQIATCLLAGLTWREAGTAVGCTSANVAYHVRQIKDKYLRWQEQSARAL